MTTNTNTNTNTSREMQYVSVSNLTLDLWLDYVKPLTSDGKLPAPAAEELTHCMTTACFNAHQREGERGEVQWLLYNLSVSIKYRAATASAMRRILRGLLRTVKPSAYIQDACEGIGMPLPHDGRFSRRTLRRVFQAATEARKDFARRIDAGEALRVSISTGNRKIGRVLNVSMMPGFACGNCSQCLHYCYDIKACTQYGRGVIDARVKNWMMARFQRDEYFAQINAAITRRRTGKYFRWHVAGDILDSDYFDRMVSIARLHPDWTFWTYTKMYHIVNAWIDANGPLPCNLHVMFSEWEGMPMDNPHGLPVFACRLKAGNPSRPADYFDNLHKCPGNCDACIAAGRGCVAGESSYADEH